MSDCRNQKLDELKSHANEATTQLKALANVNRLMILCMLLKGDLSVGQLNEMIDLSQSALSQHLAKLRADGLVTTKRDSQTIYYAIADGPARSIIEALHGHYCAPKK